MSLFESYPNINYENKNVTNILTSFLLKKNKVNNLLFFQRYVINEGETPLSIAKNLYGEENLHWVILLVNNIIDPYFDFIMQSSYIEKIVNEKYEDGSEGIHHFWNTDLEIECDDVDSEKYRENIETVPQGVRVVTNYEYESEKNNNKREIVIVNPLHIIEFVEMVRKTLKDVK